MTNNCIFCKIIRGEISSKTVFRDDNVMAFYDISPKAPVHVLVVPIRHIDSLITVRDKDAKELGNLMLSVSKIAKKLGLETTGYKATLNNGAGAGQVVFHLHIHLLGGWRKKPDFPV